MKLKHLYLIFCVLGLVLPYAVFTPYFMANGFSITEFIAKIFEHPITAFISFDLLLAALLLLVWMFVEGRRLKIQYYWLPMLAVVFIGLAFGLPLFMYLRELKLENKNK